MSYNYLKASKHEFMRAAPLKNLYFAQGVRTKKELVPGPGQRVVSKRYTNEYLTKQLLKYLRPPWHTLRHTHRVTRELYCRVWCPAFVVSFL